LGRLGELSNNRMHRNDESDRSGSKDYLRPVMLAVKSVADLKVIY